MLEPAVFDCSKQLRLQLEIFEPSHVNTNIAPLTIPFSPDGVIPFVSLVLIIVDELLLFIGTIELYVVLSHIY